MSAWHRLSFGKVTPQYALECGCANLLKFIFGSYRGLVEVQNPTQVDGSSDNDYIALRHVDSFLQLAYLLLPIAHGWKHRS